MKTKITITLLAIFSLSLNLFAGTDEPDSMYIHFTATDNSDSIVAHAIADVDSIVYYAPAAPVLADVTIGDYAHGGVVFYILQSTDAGYDANVQHGLVCAVSDQDEGSGIQWYNGSHTTTNASGTAINTGAANTDSIVAHQEVGSYAAYLCDTLTLGGYTDWFLPSKDELNEMYDNKGTINTTAASNSGTDFATTIYWSSSESNYDGAWIHHFASGSQFFVTKSSNDRVRAVRAF